MPTNVAETARQPAIGFAGANATETYLLFIIGKWSCERRRVLLGGRPR